MHHGLTLLALLPLSGLGAADRPLADFRHLLREGTWTEQWPAANGAMETRKVTAAVWTAAMQACLDAQGSLHIPAREQPYYLDGPLVLKSGWRLTADPRAEIRLRPGRSTCMVRNEHVLGFADRPVPADTQTDTDIAVSGGIWTTLATSEHESNGNLRGASARQDPVHGTHGVILLQNVRRVTVRDVTVRQSRAFAVHLANAREFCVDGLTLQQHHRDGVHVNGPASDGVIRRVQGDPWDDNVALNAWEWMNYAPSYGPIHDILIEEVTGAPNGVQAANSLRLLPGVKRFGDGSTLDCPIYNVTARRLTDLIEYKLYDQPNLELGRDKDFSVRLGSLRNLRFEDLVFNRPGRLEIHAEVDQMVVEKVTINHPLAPDWCLVAIGPKSATYKHGGPDHPEQWAEIFSPELDCTVRHLSVSGVRRRGSDQELPIEQVVHVVQQRVNPDYPRTTPRGGTGKGIWVR